MRLNVKNLIIWLLIIAVVVTFHIVRRNSTMRGIETVVTGNDICLLTERDVDSLLIAAYPTLRQTDIGRVEKRKIRQTLLDHPYILDAKVGMSAGGKLQVEVTQRAPIVRVFFQGNEFYISNEGTFMPLCAEHFCDIMIGSSEYAEPRLPNLRAIRLDDTASEHRSFALESIWRLARFIHDNQQYDGVFDQVAMTAKGDLVLTPKLGNTSVIVGDTLQLDEKFENLWVFYDQGVKKTGWDTYKTINLKYKNQLVGVKR
ncbi:MAG: hypothetical protein IJP80_00240 [Bacteroidales bacterium]|nr:hypothetical protein [Bacteroidales bacterium]